MKDFRDNIEREVSEILGRVKEDTSLPRYTRTRILATLKEKNQKSGVIHMWKRLSFGTSAAFVCMIIMFFIANPFSENFFLAKVGNPFVVRIEIEDLKTTNVANVKIDLPDGVHFYSKWFPELNQQRTLVMSWESAITNGHLPFVVQGKKSGKKTLMITFLDNNNRIISVREFRVNFEEKI